MFQTSPLSKKINFAHNFDAVQSLDELKALVNALYEQDKLIGFDIETGYSGSDYPNRATNVFHPLQFVVGFSITNDPTWARYVPLRHDFANNLDPEQAWETVKPLLEEKSGVAHNLLFEAENLRHLDDKGDGPNIYIPIPKWHDSMIQAYVLSDVPNMPLDGSINGGEFVRRFIPEFHRTPDMFQKPDIKAFLVGLKSLTKFRYNYDQAEIHSLFSGAKKLTKKEQDSIRFNTLPVDPKVVHYACDDAYLCLQLHQDQHERIMEDPYLPQVYDLEMKTVEVLADMKDAGVSVDWEGISNNYDMYESFLHNMKIRTRKLFEEETGRDLSELNFRSTQQMAKLIYGSKEEGGLELPAERTTAKGNPSTDDKALTTLRKKSPAIDSLLRYRQCIKMGEWFTLWKSLSDQAVDGKIHPSFIQVRVQSGRFASAGPNAQNVSKRWWFQNVEGTVPKVMREGVNGKDYWTGNARDFIVASPGYKLLSFDYKSAEIQFLAALSQEEEIIQAFYSDEDFHKWTASLVFGKPIEEVTKKERQAAKAQPLSEPVLTPNGWVPMGNIRPGDFVIGSDGKPTEVIDIQPQGKKKVYRVQTSDGFTRCTDEHLWTVRNTISGRGKWKTVELKELMKRPLRGRAKKEDNGKPKWELPSRPVVEFAPQEALPVDPYALGLLLGDGNLTHDWAPSFSSADPEMLEYMRNYHESLGGRISEKRRGDEDFWTQYLTCAPWESGPRNVMRNPLRLKLRELGLDQKKSVDKFIPTEYFTSRPIDRLALIQGLLDTDGSVRSPGALFHTTSYDLAVGVQELTRSLGGKASIRVKREATPENSGKFASKLKAYDVYLRLPEGMNPFKLSRKAEQIKAATRWANLTILEVAEDGEEECQCILVENKDGLYITKDFLVTHNTVSFGNIYGQSVGAMAQQLGISKDEAQTIRDKYFARFPKLAAYFEQQHDLVNTAGEVRTWLGRKAVVWERMHASGAVRSKAERMSVNIPVQGGATGDYVKMAMVRSRTALLDRGWWGSEVRLLMNQHDSLVFEVSDSLDMEEVIDLLTKQVQFNLSGVKGVHDEFESFPPMSVDWEIGYRWGSVADADQAHMLDMDRVEVELLPGATQDDINTMMDVVVTTPGDATVVVKSGPHQVTLPNKVKAHPDTVTKLQFGDPDLKIVYPEVGKVKARFV